jgi:hypothetical protein
MARKKSTYENPGEMYARWYFEELIEHGFVKRINREAETMLVLPKQTHYKVKHNKVKKDTADRITLLPDISYTYDFRVIWTKKAVNIFTEIYVEGAPFMFDVPPFISHLIKIDDVNEFVSYIDVKPHAAAAKFGGGNLASFYTFPFVQKFLMHKYGLYINKMVPTNTGKHGITTCMFAKTFVPNRYLFTDGGTQHRAIKIKRTPLLSFVKYKQGVIDIIQRENNAKVSQTSLL